MTIKKEFENIRNRTGAREEVARAFLLGELRVVNPSTAHPSYPATMEDAVEARPLRVEDILLGEGLHALPTGGYHLHVYSNRHCDLLPE